MRQSQRDPGQGWRAHVLATDGGGIDVRELTGDEIQRVDARLPLHRLDGAQTYFVAWLENEPVGHAHVAWTGTKLGVPEIQDVFVDPQRRRRGIATALSRGVEHYAARRGHARISLSVGVANEPARRLYDRLGYADAGVEPERVQGTITVRGKPFAVDDTLLYLVKDLPTVRPLAGGELPVVRAAMPRGPTIHEDRFGAQERDEGIYFFAWIGDEPAGHTFLGWSGRAGYPEARDVGVAESRRRQGLGTLLMTAAEDAARERGGDSLGLAVAFDNTDARSFYDRLGYADAGLPPFTISYEAWDDRGLPRQVIETCTYLRKPLA